MDMIEIPFWFAEAVFAVIWLTVRAIVWIKQKKIDIKREALLMLIFIDLAVIIRFTFFPLRLAEGRVQPLVIDLQTAFPFWVNLVPLGNFFSYGSEKDVLVNVIGNVAMFVPSGIVFPIVYKRLDSFPKTAAAGALLSLCVELMQLPISVRVSDINDMILNTAGVVIGYGIYALVRIVISKSKERA